VALNNIWVNRCDYETSIEVREKIQVIIECIEGLPTIYSQILRLKVFEGMDTHGIARVYGITEATVRKRLQRARELLRDKLVEACVIGEDEYNRLGY
jgi:RNA polymerase sigma-70 factor (ECF subfamily)